MANPHVAYFESSVASIDLEGKVAQCVSTVASTQTPITFEVPYSHVVLGVGEQPATFGTPGVKEHAFFMKDVSDCVQLRNRIQQQLELAEFLIDPDARADALRFVVVGGGPTGVEFAGTLSDFLFSDLIKRFPALMQHAQVVLVQSGANILPVFDEVLQEKAMKTFERLRVKVMTNVKVCVVQLYHLYSSSSLSATRQSTL